MTITLRPVSPEAAKAVLADEPPPDVEIAEGHPTDFSKGIAAQVGVDGAVGPFFAHRTEDDVVVGEIGGAFIEPDVVEIGYAVVESHRGRGIATAAVLQIVEVVRESGRARIVIGHTPPDLPDSSRVLEKAGFSPVGEVDDEHEGEVQRVTRWELVIDQEVDDG